MNDDESERMRVQVNQLGQIVGLDFSNTNSAAMVILYNPIIWWGKFKPTMADRRRYREQSRQAQHRRNVDRLLKPWKWGQFWK